MMIPYFREDDFHGDGFILVPGGSRFCGQCNNPVSRSAEKKMIQAHNLRLMGSRKAS